MPAARFDDKVSESDKKERLKILLELQEQFTLEKNRRLVGSVQSVLVEGLSKKQPDQPESLPDTGVQWSGRSGANKIVNFSQNGICSPEAAEIGAGRIVDVRIERALSHSLYGVRLQRASAAPDRKGENCYAA